MRLTSRSTPRIIEQGVTDASASTIWRWLHDRSLKPWQQRSWIFPRDPDFPAKAALDALLARLTSSEPHLKLAA